MGASFARIVENDAHHVLIRNGDGEHTIFKEIHRDASGQAGPGYVARVRSTQGVWIVDDVNGNDPNQLNDPRSGGIGQFGLHLLIRGLWKWDLTGKADAATNDGFGVARCRELGLREEGSAVKAAFEVDLRDGYTDPLVTVGYDWTFLPDRVECHATVSQHEPRGPGAYFVKEPKLVVSVGPEPEFREVAVLARDGTTIRVLDLMRLKHPATGTRQVRERERAGVRWQGSGHPTSPELSVMLLAAASAGADAELAHGSAHGLDGWAQVALGRERFSDSGESYCLEPSGGLKRRWEAAKRGDEWRSSVMFHAWEGGFGCNDCEVAARAWESGEGWVAYLAYSLSPPVA